MKKKSKKSVKAKSKKVNKTKNLVMYVENSSPKAKFFDDVTSAMNFVELFKATNPVPMDGYWVDYVIADIKGEIIPVDSEMDLT